MLVRSNGDKKKKKNSEQYCRRSITITIVEAGAGIDSEFITAGLLERKKKTRVSSPPCCTIRTHVPFL